MLISLLRQLLLSAAAVLTVTGSLPVFYGADGPLATLFEIEDAEEDEREQLIVRGSQTDAVELAIDHPVCDLTPVTSPAVLAGPQSERGPPAV
ncbi:MAG: hypothetical protein ACR2NZ_01845 [Rubripirellula sp.]